MQGTLGQDTGRPDTVSRQSAAHDPPSQSAPIAIRSISAITLATHNMARAVRFYRALGFELHYGGEDADFTSFCAGAGGYLNIIAAASDHDWSWWGRIIFHVADVDAIYERAVACGFSPSFAPRDAPWAERYFHLSDPDGHELSFARPLDDAPSS